MDILRQPLFTETKGTETICWANSLIPQKESQFEAGRLNGEVLDNLRKLSMFHLNPRFFDECSCLNGSGQLQIYWLTCSESTDENKGCTWRRAWKKIEEVWVSFILTARLLTTTYLIHFLVVWQACHDVICLSEEEAVGVWSQPGASFALKGLSRSHMCRCS